MPLIKRLPKIGFRPKRHKVFQLVNLESLSRFKEGTIVNADFLKSHGLIRDAFKPIKILGAGDLKKPFVVQANRFSKGAEDKITKAGGKAEIIKEKPPVLSQEKPKG